MSSDYDAIIVGAGAAGGIVAGVLSEAGKRVLLLERGPTRSFANVARDHLRNQRHSPYGHNSGPDDLDGNPRVSVDVAGTLARIVRPHEGGYDNNATGVGGGTVVYGAQAWRFMPQDFRMASIYGVPDGSSLMDWPISYDDLAPQYERAEWEIGVAGAEAHPQHGTRRKGYPMPPVPDTAKRRLLSRGAATLGWSAAPAPLAINTIEYNDRPACTRCSYCVGFACPVDAKNGSQNTLIKRALATGGCELVTGAVAESVECDGSGRVKGVKYLVDGGAGIRHVSATAKAVVVSGGAIESARLLLNSASRLHPEGLGNANDQVGRNLDGHIYVGANGLFDEIVNDGYGPGVSVSTCQFNHGNPGIIGGGMIADEFIRLPIIFWKGGFPPDTPKWGHSAKRFMRENYQHVLQLASPIHDIPSAEARVQVDPNVRDKYGLPVARLSGAIHPETMRTANFIRERQEEWLRASGATSSWSVPPQWSRSGGQHQSGTCRMGVDPRSSVTDTYGRVHGHDNLFVVDGSLHVTNGGFNPVLTIMALAFRCSEHIAVQL